MNFLTETSRKSLYYNYKLWGEIESNLTENERSVEIGEKGKAEQNENIECKISRKDRSKILH